MGFKMKGNPMQRNFGVGSSPLQKNKVINGVLCDAYGKPIDPKKAHEADTVNNYKGPGGKNDSNKVAKGLGSAFHYEKDPKKFAQRVDKDDQSKEGARNRGETCAKCDKLKGNCTCPEGPQARPTVKKKKSQEQIEDEKGVTTNIKMPKVMNDDGGNKWRNPHAVKSDAQKKVDAKKKEFANMTDAQKKAEQDKANAKSKAWRNSAEYKRRKNKQN